MKRWSYKSDLCYFARKRYRQGTNDYCLSYGQVSGYGSGAVYSLVKQNHPVLPSSRQSDEAVYIVPDFFLNIDKAQVITAVLKEPPESDHVEPNWNVGKSALEKSIWPFWIFW